MTKSISENFGTLPVPTTNYRSLLNASTIVLLSFCFSTPSMAQDAKSARSSDAQGSCRQDQGSVLPPASISIGGDFTLSDFDAFKFLNGVYRPLGDECYVGADLEKFACESGGLDCIQDHGTYARDEFYYAQPIHDSRTRAVNSIRLISDGSLDIVLKRDNSIPLRFTFDVKGSNKKGEVLLDGPACLGQANCFEVRNVPAGMGLRNRAYKRTNPLKPKRNDQDWGSTFKSGPKNFLKALHCYDVRTLNEDRVHAASRNGGGLCQSNGWFVLPGGGDRTFSLEPSASGENVAVPYGLRFAPRNEQWGGERTVMMETEKEINDNRSKSLGSKTGVNLIFVNAEVHRNEATTNKRQSVSKDDVTHSKFEQKEADFAVVLDRYNLQLTDQFKISVQSIAKVFMSAIDEAAKGNAKARLRINKQYESFVIQYGTHVPYATTFGKRAVQFSTYSKEAVQSLAEEGVSVSTGASAGVSMPVPELGASASANFGFDNGEAKDHAKRLAKTLGKQFKHYECFGGSSCNGQISGSDVEPIFLDLMPTSELLGPPFFLFSHPRVVSAKEKALFKDITQQDMLDLREDFRKYLAREAFFTDPKDMPTNIIANEYVRISRPQVTTCNIITYVAGKEVSTTYDGGLQNCRVSELEAWDSTNLIWSDKINPRPISATRAVVIPRPGFSNRKPQYRNVNFSLRGKIAVKPTALCGNGVNDLESVVSGTWVVNVRDGKYVDKFKIGVILPRPDPSKSCHIEVWFDGMVDVGGAALVLDAD